MSAGSNILYVPRKSYPREKSNSVATRALQLYGCLYYSDINAFFESSLRQAGILKEIPLDALVGKRTSLSHFESMVVHYRCAGSIKGDFQESEAAVQPFSGTKVLYIDSDKPSTMAADNIVDAFDLVFKREPFKDLDRYSLSYRNKMKIRPTMLSCKLHSKYKFCKQRLKWSMSRLMWRPNVKIYDVFFSGKSTEPRELAFLALKAAGFQIRGGLQQRKGFQADRSLMRSRLSAREYVKMIKSSAVNIAIGGHGPFTFRHLEVLCAGGFLLSDEAVSDLWLPIPLQDGRHMVTFRNQADLIEKVAYYLTNDSEREEIARRGNQIFRENYDTTKHGMFIRSCLNGTAEFQAGMSRFSVGA